ncbi:Three-prime repair exonuclease 1, partial [Pseudolycoriella hygida]
KILFEINSNGCSSISICVNVTTRRATRPRRACCNMNPNRINSFAFFDLETTGLPDIEFNKTKITELCLVASSKRNILDTRKGDLPRVLNKLSFCLNPFKQISTTSTQITGLDNFMLENENKFDENFVKLLNHFILQLPQPVCLVAHNGNKFDFPIIQRQLKMLDLTLPDDVQCIDSLHFFRSYEDQLQQEKLDEPKSLLDETCIIVASNAHTSEKKVNGDSKSVTTNAELCAYSNTSPINEGQCASTTSTELTSNLIDTNELLLTEDIKEKQKLNERTPSNRKIAVQK